MARDYYEVLGVAKDASESEIKSAYRKMAMANHPDRNPDDAEAEARFKEAADAYGVLSDVNKKARYDQYGHAGVGNGPGGPGGAQGFNDMNDIFSAFGDIFGSSVFGDMFGGGQQQRRRRGQGEAGSDLRVRMPLTLEEIAKGVDKTFKINHYVSCNSCDGKGAEKGTKMDACSACEGTGEIRNVSRSVFGQFINVAPCANCSGTGEILVSPCMACHGEGRKQEESTVTVTIPAGVHTGNYLTVTGSGNAGRRGGRAGDAIVVVEEQEHEYFERHDDDVYTDVVVDFPTAAMGGEVEINTLEGASVLKIDAGTQPGTNLRMKDKGIPHLNARGKGDQIVRFNVYIPESLSSDEKKILKGLSGSKNFDPKNVNTGFFSKVKEAFS